MKSDFRKDFYNKYNSTFKIHNSNFDQKSIVKLWRGYSYQYRQVISAYQKDVAVLELGCGRGYLLEYLRNLGYKNLKGIDISDEQIIISKEKGFDAKAASAIEYLESNDAKFSLIFALDFIEHFYKEELIPLFQAIFNRLDEGGTLIMHTPNGQAIASPRMVYGDLTHLTIFTPDSAMQILRLVGFRKIKFQEAVPVPKSLKGLFRLILWKIIKLVFNFIRLVETGSTEKILTQNFIIVAKK